MIIEDGKFMKKSEKSKEVPKQKIFTIGLIAIGIEICIIKRKIT